MASYGVLSISDVERIVASIQSTVVSGFGPSFQHTLVSTATGRILLTNSGIQILKTLDLEHPVSRYVVTCISCYHASTGDGSKTFILLLSELLKKSAQVTESDRNARILPNDARTRLSHDFHIVLSDILPQLFKALERYCTKDNFDNKDKLKSGLQNIISGVLSSHLMEYDSAYISKLLVSWIIQWNSSATGTLLDNLNVLVDNHRALIIENPGKPVTSSKLLPGILVSRGFCNSDITDVKASDGEKLKFILMTCSIETIEDEASASNVEMHIPDQDHQHTISKIISYKRLRTNAFLDQLKDSDVTIIFTSVALTTLEKTQCSRYGISVIHTIPEEELNLISNVMEVQLLRNALDLDKNNIGTTSQLEQRIFGSQNYIHIDCSHLSTSKPLSLIVTGSTDGISRQIYHLIVDVLKVVRSAVTSVNFKAESADLVVSMENVSLYNSMYKSSRMSEGGDSGICLTPNDQSRGKTHQTLLSPSALSPTNYTKHHIEDDDVDESSKSHVSGIPVGGAFELALYEIIGNYLSCQPAGAPGTTALAILKESLLIVPQLIHTNAFYIAKPRWLSTLADIRESLKQGHAMSVDATEGTAVKLKQMHSYNSKCHLVLNVLVTLRQLLKVDEII